LSRKFGGFASSIKSFGRVPAFRIGGTSRGALAKCLQIALV